ncbi:MAG: hypothetical protein V7707_10895 [Motiliproteus sp.]
MLSLCGVYFQFGGGVIINSGVNESVANYLWAANAWLWLMAVLGWGQVVFTQPNKIIQYLNGGVFCYYILHQSIVIVVGAWLAQFQLSVGLEFGLILVATILGCGAGYESLRRVPYLRACFGISAPKQNHPNNSIIPYLNSGLRTVCETVKLKNGGPSC